jgi:Zn ribbon nucleic-acid-binding protein
MTSEALAAAYGDATRLRAHELTWHLDSTLGNWLKEARNVLSGRGQLELIREFLPVYFDPSRKAPVFGPGGKLTSQAAIERAIAPRALKTAGWLVHFESTGDAVPMLCPGCCTLDDIPDWNADHFKLVIGCQRCGFYFPNLPDQFKAITLNAMHHHRCEGTEKGNWPALGEAILDAIAANGKWPELPTWATSQPSRYHQGSLPGNLQISRSSKRGEPIERNRWIFRSR